MGSLRDEIRESNEERQIELDSKQNARVREMQLDLAPDVEACRAVPDALKALAREHRAAAKEALETLELIDIAVLWPANGQEVDAVRRRVRYVLTMFDNGAAQAQRAVDRVDGLSYAEVKDWTPDAFARILRDALGSAASAPQTVRQIITALPLDMEKVRKIMKHGRRRDPEGAGASAHSEPQQQHYAHSRTQGT